MSSSFDLEIAIQDFQFHKRTWWMLSSIEQQIPSNGMRVPRVKVIISVHDSDAYPILLNRLTETFSRRIALDVRSYSESDYFSRGNTRAQNIANSEAKWLFFSDSDMVFHPQFFSDLFGRHLPNYSGTGKLLTAPRHNTGKDAGYQLVDSEEYLNVPISEAFNKCWSKRIEYSGRGRSPGAGYFQLVETSWLHSNGVTYSGDSDRPISSRRGNKFRSDIRFRKRFNGVEALKKDRPNEEGFIDVLKPIIHMNHWRKRDDQWRAVCH